MTYTLNRIRGKGGEILKKIESIKSASLDIDRNRTAQVFVNEAVVAEMKVMEFEVHLRGIYLRGTEETGPGKVMYQEWFLAYES